MRMKNGALVSNQLTNKKAKLVYISLFKQADFPKNSDRKLYCSIDINYISN